MRRFFFFIGMTLWFLFRLLSFLRFCFWSSFLERDLFEVSEYLCPDLRKAPPEFDVQCLVVVGPDVLADDEHRLQGDRE